MNGKEALDMAMELMMIPAESLVDYSPYALTVINGLLPRMYGINTCLCRAKGMGEEEIPVLRFAKTMEEEIPMEEELLYALPLGMCVHFSLEDEDGKTDYFKTKWEEALSAVAATAPQPVEDVYSQ